MIKDEERKKSEAMLDVESSKKRLETGTYSQRRLIWRRFWRHKAGVAGSVVVLFICVCIFLAEFIGPHNLNHRYFRFVHLPPQQIHFFADDGFHLRPFVYGIRSEFDLDTGIKRFSEDRSEIFPIYLFVRGDTYSFYGLFESDLHLFGTGRDSEGNSNPLFLMGTDRFGRDMLSRLLFGGRISMTVGLLAVFLSLTLGTTLGLISGYYGGIVDHIIQRTIEIIFSFPSIPILMALSALLPAPMAVLPDIHGHRLGAFAGRVGRPGARDSRQDTRHSRYRFHPGRPGRRGTRSADHLPPPAPLDVQSHHRHLNPGGARLHPGGKHA